MWSTRKCRKTNLISFAQATTQVMVLNFLLPPKYITGVSVNGNDNTYSQLMKIIV